jgi:hypothetical protein
MENKGNHTYKTKGLEFYITNALNKKHAVESFIHFRIGVTENDIELFEGKIPVKASVMSAIEKSIPKLGTKEFNDAASRYFGGNPKLTHEKVNIGTMKDPEYVWKEKPKSTRELALEWWNKLNVIQQMRYAQNHFTRDDSVNLTGREIEEIWRKETKEGSDREIIEEVFPDLKPNQKQFKEFNPELFKAYINKFSQEHKISMLQVLIDDLNVRALVDKSLRS